ncbi:MAG: hypothetical protein ACO3EK_06720, partial [Alphaproteobacteria bacterium]
MAALEGGERAVAVVPEEELLPAEREEGRAAGVLADPFDGAAAGLAAGAALVDARVERRVAIGEDVDPPAPGAVVVGDVEREARGAGHRDEAAEDHVVADRPGRDRGDEAEAEQGDAQRRAPRARAPP